MYDHIAHFYDFFSDASEAKAAFLSGFVKRGDRILDIGAGTGSLGFLLSSGGYDVTCLEPSPAMQSVFLTRVAEKKLSGREAPTLIPGDITKLPRTHRFELALAAGVLYLMPKEGERLLLLDTIKNQMMDGGHFIFSAAPKQENRPDQPLKQVGQLQVGKNIYKHWAASHRNDAKSRKVTWIYETWLAEKMIDRIEEDFIVYQDTYEDLQSFLESSDFVVKHAFDGFSKKPYAPESASLVIVATVK